MRRIFRKEHAAKVKIGRVVTGVLLGSIAGATVGWLAAPASGEELLHRIKQVGNGSRRSVQKRVKAAEENVESRACELAAEVNENAGDVRQTVTRRRRVASTY